MLEFISYTSRSEICLVVRGVRSFSYTFRLEICLVVRYMGSLSETPCAGLYANLSVGEYLLHAPCWNLPHRLAREESLSLSRAENCLVVRRVRSLSYSPHAGICPVVWRVDSFSYTPLAGICLVVRRAGSLS